jgi:uncharacterized membrane protein YhaH (DUF805 family)
MEWMLMPYRRYADFSGRSRRKEYWMFVLFTVIVYAVCGALIAMGGAFSVDPNTGAPEFGMLAWLGFGLLGVFVLANIIPTLAVHVRRFHDQDKSGWFYLLIFIPYAGSIIVLVFMCIEGTKGENRFGSDPKGASNLGDVFA